MPRVRANRNKSSKFDWLPSPSEEQEILAIREVYKNNPRKFLEDNFRIISRDNPSELEVVQFKPNFAQDQILRLRDEIRELNIWRSTELKKKYPEIQITDMPINIVIVKPRKVGVSTLIRGLNQWKCEFFPHTTSILLGHDAEAIKTQIMPIDQRYRDCWINPHELDWRIPLNRSSDTLVEWGLDGVTGQEWDSRIIVKTAGVTVKASARGSSSSFNHLMEVAHYKSASEFSGIITGRLQASETYVESTSNGAGGLFYNLVQNSRSIEDVRDAVHNFQPIPGWNSFVHVFFSWLDDPGYSIRINKLEREHILSTLTDIEIDLIESHKANPEQLAWRRNKIATDGHAQTDLEPEEFFRQEFPVTIKESFVAKGNGVFEPKYLYELQNSSPTPIWTGVTKVKHQDGEDLVTLIERRGADEFEVFEECDPNEDYVIGADMASGRKGGDYTNIVVYKRENEDLIIEVARYNGKADPDEAAFLIAHLAQHYNDAYIIPERNYPGNATCLALFRLNCPHVYYSETEEKIDDLNAQASYLGFQTTAQSKAYLVSEAKRHLRSSHLIIRSKKVLDQWLEYKNDNGTYSAPAGGNDDAVMADMLAIWAHFSGKCPEIRKYAEAPKPKSPTEIAWDSIQKHVTKTQRKDIARAKHPFRIRNFL